MKRALTYLFIFTYTLYIYGQVLPNEKVYFQTDKMAYSYADTLIVEGKLMRADQNDTSVPYSRYVYVEFFNENDSVLTRQRLSVDEQGAFRSYLPMNGYPQGVYYLRAFSKMMGNFPSTTFPIFPIEVYSNTPKVISPANSASINCDFYPEGGSIQTDVPQNLAVKISDELGQPVRAKTILFTQEGDTLMRKETTNSGWQVLRFIPSDKQNYLLKVVTTAGTTLHALPKPEKSDVIHAQINRQRLIYQAFSHNPEHQKIYIYHQALGLMVFPVKENGVLDLSGCPEGTVSVMLTNEDNQILSETHCWFGASSTERVKIPETLKQGAELDFKTFIANEESTVFARFLPWNSLENALLRDFIPSAETQVNFFSDVDSPQPFPLYYSLEEKNEQKTDMTAWLYSAHFKRLELAETLKNGFNLKYQPEQSIVFKGRIIDKEYKWKIKNGTIMAYQRSNQNTSTADVDGNAYFELAVGDFPDEDDFYLQAYDSNGKDGVYSYEILNDTLPSLINWNRVGRYDSRLETNSQNPTQNAHFSFTGINKLPEIVIKARLTTENKKPSRQFYGHRYITQEKMEEYNPQDFEQLVLKFWTYIYLQRSMKHSYDKPTTFRDKGGVTTTSATQSHYLYSRRSANTISGNTEVSIFLDGKQISTDEAMFLNMSDIATAEYLTPSEAGGMYRYCLNGVFLMKTKNATNKKKISKGIIYEPPFGVANYKMPYIQNNIVVPTVEGPHLLLIDVLTPQGVRSYGFKVDIKP